VPETERVTARYDNARRQAALQARQAAIDETVKEIERLAHEAEAMKAGVAAAKTALAKAVLDLERTRIVAPIDGRVARLLAVPGQKKMAKMDDIDSATIVILYDPAKVQARVDVPLADAAGLSVGQPVKIRCNLLPDQPFDGVVTRINGEADLQRNTLQAKVRLLQPSDRLRPEMLCRAEFYEARGETPATPGAPAALTHAALAVYVPEDSLTENAVWICDPDTSRVAKRAVAAATESRDGFRRLDSGVLPGEWVVRRPSGLRANQRVLATRVP
jgi:multidrug efflux pump subunit AcrA (membrane-fusion protein)